MPILHISDTIALRARKHRIFTEWCVVESLHYLDNRKIITLKLGKNLFSQLNISVLAEIHEFRIQRNPENSRSLEQQLCKEKARLLPIKCVLIFIKKIG
jgi:hypothetical protein